MAEISIGGAVGSGFGIITRRPGAVLLWGALQVGFVAAMFGLMAPMFATIFHAAQQGAAAQASGAAAPPPPDPTAMMPQMIMFQGLSYLMNLVQLLLNAVLYCAVWRAVIHPEQSRWGYLRVGAAELFFLIIVFGASMALGMGMVILIIPFAVIIGILVATHLIPVAIIVGIVGLVALFLALIYFGMRFSLVGPMLVEDGKFHLFESWTLTRGHVGQLFAIALAMIGIVFICELVVVAVLGAIGAAGLGLAAGGFDHLGAFFGQPLDQILLRLAPVAIIFILALVPVSGGAMAVFSAPWAHAYRDLVPHRPDASDAFA